jgi:hypothetical protein
MCAFDCVTNSRYFNMQPLLINLSNGSTLFSAMCELIIYVEYALIHG